MPGPKRSAEQIVRKPRTTEVELGKGLSIKAVCKKPGITGLSRYRWRKESDQGRSVRDPDISHVRPLR